jgi:hypothetical protein
MGANFPGSFGYDREFLTTHDSSLVVLRRGDMQILVSPKYQGKVFTSTDSGYGGPSFGWIHYKAFDRPLDVHMNAYGGENRLWLGPEGGRFSLFFPKGSKMEFANWKTPAAFDSEPWQLVQHTDTNLELRKDLQLVNYAGTKMSLSIMRWIWLLDRAEVYITLGLGNNIPSVSVVGYQTTNFLTNFDNQALTDSSGMPCIWMLDMFKPSPATTIVIPYSSARGDTSKPATTDYFGEIPSARIKFSDSVLYFKADGKSRGKLGIHPSREKDVAGSYDAERKVLTIIYFQIDPTAQFLNQEWDTVKPPFSGDAVNAYNDGPLADGSQMGPFYELESVSPVYSLPFNGHIIHRHLVFHFTGSEAGLDIVSRKVLGVSLKQIEGALK